MKNKIEEIIRILPIQQVSDELLNEFFLIMNSELYTQILISLDSSRLRAMIARENIYLHNSHLLNLLFTIHENSHLAKENDTLFKAKSSSPWATQNLGGKENPIQTTGNCSSQIYLSELKFLNGESIKWEREGSILINEVPTDIYCVTNSVSKQSLYICPYHQKISRADPVGFKFF